MVPTAINHRNTSAMSTGGRRGEYSCTDTVERQKFLRRFRTPPDGVREEIRVAMDKKNLQR